MAEIILNPEVEILDENDRKLYWLFRQTVDTKFLAAMNHHLKENDHCYNICFNQYIDVRQLSLKQFIDQHSQHNHPRDVLEQLSNSIGDELTDAITNMIALYRECQRRGIKIK